MTDDLKRKIVQLINDGLVPMNTRNAQGEWTITIAGADRVAYEIMALIDRQREEQIHGG